MLTKKYKGFTLIELLVVIAIIGILSSIVLVSVNSARDKAKDAAVKSNVEGTRVAAELYYDSHGSSYADVCTSPDFVRIQAAVQAQNATWICGSSTTVGYCASGSLVAPAGVWCADSSGYAGSSKPTCTASTGSACQ